VAEKITKVAVYPRMWELWQLLHRLKQKVDTLNKETHVFELN